MASPTPTPALESIAVDTHCIYCGYNLRGLLPDSRCPECGHLTDDTLRIPPRPTEWVRQLHIGLLLYLYRILFVVLAAVLPLSIFFLRYSDYFQFGTFPFYFLLHTLPPFVPEIILLAAVWFLTKPRPGVPHISLQARLLRVLTFAMLANNVLWSILTNLFVIRIEALYWTEYLADTGMGIAFTWLFWSRLLVLIPPTYPLSLARAVRRLRIVTLVVVAVQISNGLGLRWLLDYVGRSEAQNISLISGITVGIFSLIVGLWSVWVLFALRRQFKREAPVTTLDLGRLGVSWLKQAASRVRYYAGYHGQGRR
ncbi:MAG: hypothetical protein WCI73_16860 [Phycisphaerae bacterium]